MVFFIFYNESGNSSWMDNIVTYFWFKILSF